MSRTISEMKVRPVCLKSGHLLMMGSWMCISTSVRSPSGSDCRISVLFTPTFSPHLYSTLLRTRSAISTGILWNFRKVLVMSINRRNCAPGPSRLVMSAVTYPKISAHATAPIVWQIQA